jgi:hypothetical protein
VKVQLGIHISLSPLLPPESSCRICHALCASFRGSSDFPLNRKGYLTPSIQSLQTLVHLWNGTPDTPYSAIGKRIRQAFSDTFGHLPLLSLSRLAPIIEIWGRQAATRGYKHNERCTVTHSEEFFKGTISAAYPRSRSQTPESSALCSMSILH